MTLCNLCAEIPWDSLPLLPSEWHVNLTGQKYIHNLFGGKGTVPPQGAYTHHQSFEQLSASAQVFQCEICKLVSKSAENVQQELESLKPHWEAGRQRKRPLPLWELWMVRRKEGGPGVWVMSETDDGELYIIAAIGLCAREGDPLERIFSGRPIERNPGSKRAIATAQKWLIDCNKHANCNFGDARLPSRVIDVGSAGTFVHLHETNGQELGRYVSLSYCWGNSTKFITSKANLESRKQGIAIAEMPETHQNAISIARAFGLRYLWIDSLCICQDDKANWERESANMLHIYASAYLTIGAFVAKESSEGFFRSRSQSTYVELDYISPAPDKVRGRALAFSLPLREELVTFDYAGLPREPLSSRAWAFQERILSRRKLVYGTTQMYFECCEGFKAENGLQLEDLYHNLNLQLVEDPKSKAETVHNKFAFPTELVSRERTRDDKDEAITNEKDVLRRMWNSMLWTYGERKLTKPSDKLPAISGIASIFSDWMDDKYIAGLWKSDILGGLMWQGLQCRRVAEFRAPSWSWASIDGIPATDLHIDRRPIAEIVDYSVELKGQNPYGEVTSGWIKLRAPLEQLFFLEGFEPAKPRVAYGFNPRLRTAHGDPEGEHSRFDFAFTQPDAMEQIQKIITNLEGVEIFALVLFSTPSEEYHDQFHCLIVRRADGSEHLQRLGFIHLDESTLGRKAEDLHESLQEITLI